MGQIVFPNILFFFWTVKLIKLYVQTWWKRIEFFLLTSVTKFFFFFDYCFVKLDKEIFLKQFFICFISTAVIFFFLHWFNASLISLFHFHVYVNDLRQIFAKKSSKNLNLYLYFIVSVQELKVFYDCQFLSLEFLYCTCSNTEIITFIIKCIYFLRSI